MAADSSPESISVGIGDRYSTSGSDVVAVSSSRRWSLLLLPFLPHVPFFVLAGAVVLGNFRDANLLWGAGVLFASLAIFSAGRLIVWWLRAANVMVLADDTNLKVVRNGRLIGRWRLDAIDQVVIGPSFSLFEFVIDAPWSTGILPTVDVFVRGSDVWSCKILLRSEAEIGAANESMRECLGVV